MTYDASGNLLTLQRNRETGTLIDNLSYTIAATSNRLISVTDAVPTTTETWDAETGSFTYDANGNVLTAPAPYSITAVTYDAANLPLTITRSGTTTKYRYDDAGQRIAKQVGTGNIEVYINEASSDLGVFTLTSSGSLSTWYFNLVWQDRVIGRQPNSGARSYYHLDALGSTRAVTQGATITESYDFEPWGLLMPGRTRTGATKEGFTGKEQDAETGLDYFGARYYMPALARWTAVDPLAEKSPTQSPYAYSGDNPTGNRDVDGRYYVGTDGKPVVVTMRQGSIHLSSNASPELQRMATLINRSGSAKATSQFVNVGNNETKVHFRISQDLKRSSDGIPLLGLHQAHNAAGTALEWDVASGTFRGQVAFGVDKHGKLIYREATVTVYEATIRTYESDPQAAMVAVGAHENEHDLNTEDIKAIKDRGEGKPNSRKVEVAAGDVEDQVLREIQEARKKKKRDQDQ